MTRQNTAPHVYRAINSITSALSKVGIAKLRANLQDQYLFRSIDDVVGHLAPLLAQHRLCILPRVLRRESNDRPVEDGMVLVSVHVLVAYDLVSCRDGSRHTVRASGEAVDPSDKATAKALSAAYKSAMLQIFCIPVSGSEEPDRSTHRLRKPILEKEPAGGWQAWSSGMVDMIDVCESGEALDRVRHRHGPLLTSISRERPDLFTEIGKAFTARVKDLPTSASPPAAQPLLKGAPTKTDAKFAPVDGD